MVKDQTCYGFFFTPFPKWMGLDGSPGGVRYGAPYGAKNLTVMNSKTNNEKYLVALMRNMMLCSGCWVVYVLKLRRTNIFSPTGDRWVLSSGAKQGKVILHKNMILCTKF